MQIFINVVLLAILIYLIYDRFKPVKGLAHLTEEEIREKLKKPQSVVLIDVRQPYEYKADHIPGAINIPLSQLKKKKTVIPDKEIILYCQTGIRSKFAANALRKKKVQTLGHLKGGLYEWNGNTTGSNGKNGKGDKKVNKK